jgi:hypothetical protein
MLACHDVIDLSVHDVFIIRPQLNSCSKQHHHNPGMSIVGSLRRLPYTKFITEQGYNPYRPAVCIPVINRRLHTSRTMMSPVKRKAEKAITPPKTKKSKVVVPEYHLTPSRQNESGETMWPAREEQIERAREIIKEW